MSQMFFLEKYVPYLNQPFFVNQPLKHTILTTDPEKQIQINLKRNMLTFYFLFSESICYRQFHVRNLLFTDNKKFDIVILLEKYLKHLQNLGYSKGYMNITTALLKLHRFSIQCICKIKQKPFFLHASVPIVSPIKFVCPSYFGFSC